MAQQRAVVKELEAGPAKKAKSPASVTKKSSYSFSIKCDLAGTCEVSFSGSMTKKFLAANRFAANDFENEQIERAFINLTEVSKIDKDGVELLLQLMKKIERANVRFQLLYSDDQVGSMIESSGLASYFTKPTWVYA